MDDFAHFIADSVKWVFLSLFAILAVWESIAQRRQPALSKTRRWGLHWLVFAVQAFGFRMLYSVGSVATAAAVAAAAQGNPYGLINRPGLPYGWRLFLGIVAFDLVHYVLHRLNHSIFWMWRTHLLHHSDRDFDVTNAFRTHPLEIGIQRLAILPMVFLLAPPPLAVALYSLMDSALGLFIHANIRIPATLERILRLVVVTPQMHQIHHSLRQSDQQTNMGAVLSWWDFVFGTYRAAPAKGIEDLAFGVEEVDPVESMSLRHMLAAPFQTLPAAPQPAPARSAGRNGARALAATAPTCREQVAQETT